MRYYRTAVLPSWPRYYRSAEVLHLHPPLVPQATEGSTVLGAVVRCGTTAERYYRDDRGTTALR